MEPQVSRPQMPGYGLLPPGDTTGRLPVKAPNAQANLQANPWCVVVTQDPAEGRYTYSPPPGPLA